MTTLHEVWRLALPPATTLRAGTANRQVVRAAIVLRSTQPALPELHGGELVLVSPPLLEALDPRLTLAHFLGRVRGTALTAVAWSGAVDRLAIEAAEANQQPLFMLPNGCDLRSVGREIERLLADPEAQYERRAAQLYTALTRSDVMDAGRYAVLEILEQWTGYPALFPAEHAAAWSVPVYSAGRLMGKVGSSGNHPWIRLALEQGAAALTLLLDKERAVQATEDRLRGDAFDALLGGLPLDNAGLRRAVEQGIDLEATYVLLALQPTEQDPWIGFRLLYGGRLSGSRRKARSASAMERSLPQFRLPALPQLLIALPKNLVRPIHTSITADGLRSDGGFSVALRLADWPVAWSEALTALRLGRDMLGPGVLAGGAELGVYQLLLGISDSAQARNMYGRTIGPLAAHDARQDGDLVHTLHVFFIHLGNHSQASAALHIHRNTLLYRLGRITAITGHQLDRSADRLALQVGLALHRIFASKQLTEQTSEPAIQPGPKHPLRSE